MPEKSDNAIHASKDVLVWARKVRGLSQSEAATELGISEGLLKAIEDGAEHPNASLFNAMITVYKQPESVLLLANPPDTPPVPQDYRTAGSKTTKLSPETRLIVREVQEVQQFISELVNDEPHLMPRSDLPRISLDQSPHRVAVSERERLGVPLSTQLRWTPQESFEKWRNRLQGNGILVFLKKMPWDDCRGFSLEGADLLPAIIVNAEDVTAARTFTLFHEYGHLLLRQAGICTLTPKSKIERWCNVFAATFLAPSVQLLEYIRATYPQAGPDFDWPIARLTRLASHFRVSRPVMALRVQELGMAPPDYFDKHYGELNVFDRRRKPSKPPKIKKAPGWKEKQRLREVGLRAASVIVEAWKEQITDATEAADILNLSLDELHGLQVQTEVQRIRNVS
jgi:Zn-dependent peptidase ImmA (M78 family)/DNA-binding XRE family transcriptional regulator